MITCIIIAKDESENIDKALNSAIFCDEILLIDNGSKDNTSKIASDKATRIIKYESNDFSDIRNFGLDNAKYSWVLFLDSDEIISIALKEEILLKIKNKSNTGAYYIKRREFFWNKEIKYGEVLKNRKKGMIRLVKKGSGKWQGKVHEEYETQDEKEMLDESLIHYPHPTISDFLRSINHYSTLRAEELAIMKRRTNVFEIIYIPVLKFFYTYIVLGGFLDGVEGYIYSFMMSLHSFLVRGKLYQLQNA